jgi:hypothetical protein
MLRRSQAPNSLGVFTILSPCAAITAILVFVGEVIVLQSQWRAKSIK